MKKSAITYAETLICLLMMGMAAMSAFNLTAEYRKTVYERQIRKSALLENMNIAEKVRAEVQTLPQLCSLLADNPDISARAVGIGDIRKNADGSFEILENDRDTLPEFLRSDKARVICLEIGSDKNTKINTVVVVK